MIFQHAFEHCAQIGGRFEIAVLVQIGTFQARPIGDDAAALERAADKERDRRGAVVGAVGAVDTRGAAEFGGKRDYGILPGTAHIGFDGGERIVERAEELRQSAGRDAFIDMRVPAVERKRADARTIRLRQKSRGIAGGVREIGAHLRRPWTAGFLAYAHIARLFDGRQLGIIFQHACELGIGMAIEIE